MKWDSAKHRRFVEALDKYGKQEADTAWTSIAQYVDGACTKEVKLLPHLMSGTKLAQIARRHALAYYSALNYERPRTVWTPRSSLYGYFQGEDGCSYNWTRKERLMIEKELANYGHKNLERFERVARKLKKPVDEIREYFQRLGRDVELIQKGSICVPRYDALDEKRMATSQFISSPSITNIIAPQIPEIEADSESRKGMPWTEEEHTQFLLGLQECGKGEWRAIAKTFVKTRTGTQVASHAQKFFLRLRSLSKDDRV